MVGIAGIAQLGEQRTENPRVTSSNLVPGKTKINCLSFKYIKLKQTSISLSI